MKQKRKLHPTVFFGGVALAGAFAISIAGGRVDAWALLFGSVGLVLLIYGIPKS